MRPITPKLKLKIVTFYKSNKNNATATYRRFRDQRLSLHTVREILKHAKVLIPRTAEPEPFIEQPRIVFTDTVNFAKVCLRFKAVKNVKVVLLGIGKELKTKKWK